LRAYSGTSRMKDEGGTELSCGVGFGWTGLGAEAEIGLLRAFAEEEEDDLF
jgi:hypothetical protein